MKIDLIYFINKRNISLKNFCELNCLKSYADLLEYCDDKNMLPVSEEKYNSEVLPPPKKVVAKVIQNEKQTRTESKPKTTTRRRSRKTPKKSQSRSNTKKEDK